MVHLLHDSIAGIIPTNVPRRLPDVIVSVIGANNRSFYSLPLPSITLDGLLFALQHFLGRCKGVLAIVDRWQLDDFVVPVYGKSHKFSLPKYSSGQTTITSAVNFHKGLGAPGLWLVVVGGWFTLPSLLFAHHLNLFVD